MEDTPNERTNERTSERKSRKLLVLAGLVAASMAAVPAVASAQGGGSDAAPASKAVLVVDQGALPEGVDVDDVEFLEDGDFEELSDEELAEIAAIEEELADVLEAAGIEYEWIEEDGFRWVEIDWEDEAAVEVVDDFYSEKFPLTADDIAEINAETSELVDALEAAGVPVTVETDDDGITYFEIDSEDEAVLEAAEAVFAEMFGDDFIEFEGCDDDFEFEELDEDDFEGEGLDEHDEDE